MLEAPGLKRLDDWKDMSPFHWSTLDYLADGRIFIRLMVPHRWSVSQKDFPTEWINGRQKEFLISAIGYGSDLDEALDEAFSRLPG